MNGTPPKTVVVALGGNALLRQGEPPEAEVQRVHVAEAAETIARIAAVYNLVVTHGNGPQVGLLALQAAALKAPKPYPLDILGAESEGMIGYMLEQELAGRLQDREVATLLTLVEVDSADPAFAKPGKPIGAFYDKSEARRLRERFGWTLMEIGDAVRRVVPSPAPRRVLELHAIRLLLAAGVVTICAGGGGIPVTAEDAGFKGIEAVIDKDRTAALLARELEADQLVILTDVSAVCDQWSEPGAREIRRATPDRLRALDFAAGSMLPKVEAACDFVTATGRPAAIGSLRDGFAVAGGQAGTRIFAGDGVMEYY